MKAIMCESRATNQAWSFRGATEGGEPGIHNSRPVVMDSGLAASDLGFTHPTLPQAGEGREGMRTMATADGRWRPGMTWQMFQNFKSIN